MKRERLGINSDKREKGREKYSSKEAVRRKGKSAPGVSADLYPGARRAGAYT